MHVFHISVNGYFIIVIIFDIFSLKIGYEWNRERTSETKKTKDGGLVPPPESASMYTSISFASICSPIDERR